jgi:hypothetical protein
MWFAARKKEPVVTLGTRWNIPLVTRYAGLRKFRLKGKQLRTHKYTIGLSEQGKSYLLAQAATELQVSGGAFAMIDPHQDLAHDTLRLIYESGFFNRPGAYEKLWYVDFSRRDRFIPFNVLKMYNGKRELLPLDMIAENMKLVIQRAFPAMAGGVAPNFENIFQFSAVALAANSMPLPVIEQFLTIPEFRKRMLFNCPHMPTNNFFHNRFEKWDARTRADNIESTLNKISIITLSDPLLHSLLQLENVLDFRYLIDNGISVIFNLGGLGEQAQKLLGCLLTVGFEQAAINRSDGFTQLDKRKDYHLLIDEFHTFCNAEGSSLERILSQCRKFQLYVWLAHQTKSQLTESLQGAVQNVGVQIYFAVGAPDSRLIAPFTGRFNPKEIKHEVRALGNNELAVEPNPAYYQWQEQEILRAQKLEYKWAQEIYVKIKRKVKFPWQEKVFQFPYKELHLRTLTVPKQRCEPEELQKIKEYYASLLHKPFDAKDYHMTGVTSPAPVLARRSLPLQK